MFVIYFVKNYVHRLSDPRDPAYPFSDTYICSKCNERLTLDTNTCDICNLYIYGEVDSSALDDPSTYPEPAPFNKSFIVDKINTTLDIDEPDSAINPDIDPFVKSIFNQAFVILMLLGVLLIAFLYLDYTSIVADYNQQLIGN